MCAINGILLRTNRVSSELAARWCQSMTSSMRHRGPNDQGFLFDESRGVFLGHRRLAIIDLSDAGKQPMSNEDQSIALLVNGEIYNHLELRKTLENRGHHFRSRCDIETVIHLFEDKGIQAWNDLRGMFAIAIYNSRNQEIILTRDPLGIKPLYLFEDEDFFAFASEIRAFEALFEMDRGWDGDGIVDFLMWGSIPAPHTHLRGVRALRPGETLKITRNQISSYGGSPLADWCREACSKSSSLSVESFREVLRDSVVHHLLSEVPIGLFLSGGIDSGTLTGIASEVSNHPVHTVSVSIPGHPLNEGPLAQQIATTYGTKHTCVELTQQMIEADLNPFFDHLDLPSIDGFNTFIVSKAAREAGLTVALSGLGGDELFEGYPSFQMIPKIRRLLQCAGSWGTWGRGGASILLKFAKGGSAASRVSEIIHTCPPDIRGGYLACRGLFVGSLLKRLLVPDLWPNIDRAEERFLHETQWLTTPEIPDRLAIGILEFSRYMTQQLLRDTDALSMAHSLEVRTPLVDREVVRSAFSFLASPIQGDAHPKWILRSAVNPPLPATIVHRKKQGFVFPWQEWLRGVVLQDFDHRIENSSHWRDFLEPRAVRWWRNAYVRGWAHWSYFWAIYVLIRVVERAAPRWDEDFEEE